VIAEINRKNFASFFIRLHKVLFWLFLMRYTYTSFVKVILTTCYSAIDLLAGCYCCVE